MRATRLVVGISVAVSWFGAGAAGAAEVILFPRDWLVMPIAVGAPHAGLARNQAPATLLRSAGDEARRAPIDALRRRAGPLAASFASHVHTNAKGEAMPYRLFTPSVIEPGRSYPLVVFLHGAGGSGTDNRRQLEGANVFGALSWALPERQARHPAFVLAPQSDVNWPCVIIDPRKPARVPGDLVFCRPGILGDGARMAFEIIDALLQRLPIDARRIYVTGHSMGGAGAWHMIAHRPRFFAAAVPVCGHPLPATAALVRDVPVWNFHGDADVIEPVTTSRAMIAAMRKAGGSPRHTEYADVGHDVFQWVYTEPDLFEWVFAQHR